MCSSCEMSCCVGMAQCAFGEFHLDSSYVNISRDITCMCDPQGSLHGTCSLCAPDVVGFLLQWDDDSCQSSLVNGALLAMEFDDPATQRVVSAARRKQELIEQQSQILVQVQERCAIIIQTREECNDNDNTNEAPLHGENILNTWSGILLL